MCLFELFTLPFKMLYWFFKAIGEILELLSGHHRHRRHSKRHSRRRLTSNSLPERSVSPDKHTKQPKGSSISKTPSSRKVKVGEYRRQLDVDISIARNANADIEMRLLAYHRSLNLSKWIAVETTGPESSKAYSFHENIKQEFQVFLNQNPDVENRASENSGELDPLFMDAVDFVIDSSKASVSSLQRHFRIGYARSARIIDQMEQNGIVGPFEGGEPRNVLISPEMWLQAKSSFHTKTETVTRYTLSESEATTDA